MASLSFEVTLMFFEPQRGKADTLLWKQKYYSFKNFKKDLKAFQSSIFGYFTVVTKYEAVYIFDKDLYQKSAQELQKEIISILQKEFNYKENSNG